VAGWFAMGPSFPRGAGPNQSLQQTAAAILVPRDITALGAAAAAELCVRRED
jgi:hypothetical protein